MSKRIKLGIILGIVLLVLCIGWLFISGRLTLVVGDTDSSTTGSASIICGADEVSIYNDAMFYAIRDGSDKPTLDDETLKNLDVSIRAKDNFAKDPTCQTLLFWIAIKDKAYDRAATAYQAVKRLHSEQRFANSNIRNNAALFEYDSALEQISPSNDSQNNTGGGNGG